MAAKKLTLQGYNFPFCGEENVSQSFVDYGSPSMLNIDLDELGKKLVSHSRQSYDSQLQRLAANQLSLPFLEPNERSLWIPEETLFDYQSSGRAYKNQERFEMCTMHVDNFSADQPDIMYSTITELVQDDMNAYPWNTCNMLKLNSFLPWKRKETSCKLCSNFRQAFADKNSNTARVIKDLASALPDLSPVLLYDLFQESHALEISRLHYDPFLGNCLACYPLETDHKGLLMYPSGPGLDILNFSHISQCADNESAEISSLSPLKPVLTKQQFEVQGKIRQIDFASYSHNNIIVGMRSQYHCSFFQSYPSTSGEEGETLSLKPLEALALTRQAMCIAVSPYIPGEAITVTETGTVYLWSCDHSMRTVHQANNVESKNSPWSQCVFASNPRCIALADSKGMDLLDFRVATLFQRLFFSIPSSEVDSFECISAIQRHPENSHHYVLATDQSLMLLDDRFLHHPVLKWRHHNEDPVQFIDVVCNAIPECHDTVLVISGSNHRTHCFQYSDSQVQAECSPNPLLAEQQCLPPQSTSLPWKVSSYDEWYHTGLSSDLAFSPATASRLSQPLIGVCTMKHTYPQGGFTVFQMSSVGDLFYQPFDSKGSKDSEGKHKESGVLRSDELSPEAKILCQKWIHIADGHKDNFVKTAPCQFEYVETEKGLLCYSIASLPESHPCCVLCNDRQGAETVTDQAQSESSICERCGVEIMYGSNLVKNQQNQGVLTKSSLNVQHNVKELRIFPDLKMATDPLSKSLWVNWNSTEPVPVILSVDKKTETQPDIQEKTVNKEMTPLIQNATSTHISNSAEGNVHKSSPQKQSTPTKSQAVDNPPKVKTEKKPARHVMGF